MPSSITPGLAGTASLIVAPEHTAPFVGSGRIAVLAIHPSRNREGLPLVQTPWL
jgi:hypothetical protein